MVFTWFVSLADIFINKLTENKPQEGSMRKTGCKKGTENWSLDFKTANRWRSEHIMRTSELEISQAQKGGRMEEQEVVKAHTGRKNFRMMNLQSLSSKKLLTWLFACYRPTLKPTGLNRLQQFRPYHITTNLWMFPLCQTTSLLLEFLCFLRLYTPQLPRQKKRVKIIYGQKNKTTDQDKMHQIFRTDKED